ncbi:hypothetical protein BDV30DRAFT_244626 [Aspergillus minisclerotigenes]|uniref:Uncharacterized protein n=1 Tax=Aspergillus minisclerotigenes TaxID=656917 RepID=A0A5N6IPM1_9EURO|nr:hypothetical protein BDV30DRAFT_244626 [Aspergillus minisclerotigenes]
MHHPISLTLAHNIGIDIVFDIGIDIVFDIGIDIVFDIGIDIAIHIIIAININIIPILAFVKGSDISHLDLELTTARKHRLTNNSVPRSGYTISTLV